MHNGLIAVIVVVVVVAAAAVAWFYYQKQRSARLRARFGPEYQRVVQESGSRVRAERELERREKRVERMHIRSLTPEERERFAVAWRQDQAHFVDDPQEAVIEADRLVAEVMKTRGYPVANLDMRLEDISVDHPNLVRNYMAAREIVSRQQRGEASTEDLRQALVYFRALFDDLLDVQGVTR